MHLQIAIYELAAQHRLAPAAINRLRQLCGLDEEPAQLSAWLPRGIAVLGAALGGFGMLLWIAANWDLLGRWGQFALLQGFVGVMCVGAAMRTRARVPLGLLAMLGIGGLFAYFGQTYQTGADPWQLFALWALLALPLCLAARSDVLWAPWMAVAMTAISLWLHAHAGHRWIVRPEDLWAHLLSWCAVIALGVGGSLPLRRFTGAGSWAFRTLAALGVTMVTFTAIAGLFDNGIAHYLCGLILMTGAAGLLAQRGAFDVFASSAVALGLVTLLTSGLARLLFSGHTSDFIGPLLLLGMGAAGLLAIAVKLVLQLAATYNSQGETA